MSPEMADERESPRSFPRVSGDEPPEGGEYWAIRTFSPRERG